MTWARTGAIVLAAPTCALVAAAVTTQIVAGSASGAAEVALTSTVALVITALALLVGFREPRNALAAVMGAMGLLAAVTGFSDTYRPAQLSDPAALPPLPAEAYALMSVSWAWLYAALTLLFLLFPTGRPLSRRWAWLVPLLLLDTVAIHVIMVTAPGPLDPPYQDLAHPFGTMPAALSVGLRVLTIPPFMAAMLLAATSLVLRYRRGEERTPRQIKWLVLTVPLLPLTFILSWGGLVLAGTHEYAGIGIAAMYVAVPLATTGAVLRHDLFDVDRAIAATAAYSVLTLGVVGVFLVAAAASGTLLGGQSPLVAATVTAAVAVALGPARRRVQRASTGCSIPGAGGSWMR